MAPSPSAALKDLWDDLQLYFDELEQQLRTAVAPNLKLISNSHRSGAYAFAATVGFSLSGSIHEEDLVFTIYATSVDPWLWRLDLARGNGLVLADRSFQTATAGAAMEQVVSFFQANRSIIDTELGKDPT